MVNRVEGRRQVQDKSSQISTVNSLKYVGQHPQYSSLSRMAVYAVYAELCVSRIFKILSIQRHSYFFGKILVALKRAGCYVVHLMAVSPVPVSRNFFNSLLIPRFVQLFSGNLSVNLFAVYLFKYNLFITILSSSLNTMFFVDRHCNDICCDEFLVPQIDHNSK